MGFTLSKINLLILVTALFSIVSFFTFNLATVFLVQETQRDLTKYAKTAEGLLNPATVCDSKPVPIPSKYYTFGTEFLYTLKVTALPETLYYPDGSTADGTRLIFSISDKKSESQIISSSSFATVANVHVYTRSTGTFQLLGSNDPLLLNPQAIVPENTLYLVKQTVGGTQHLYVFPCTEVSSTLSCALDKKTVSGQVKTDQGEEYAFKC